MVAFAGRKYAARSPPAFVANGSYIVSSFTLVIIKSILPIYHNVDSFLHLTKLMISL